MITCCLLFRWRRVQCDEMSAKCWSELPFEGELPMLKVRSKNPLLPGPQRSLQAGHRSMALFMKVARLHMSVLQSTVLAPGPPVSIPISAFMVLCRPFECKQQSVSNVWRTGSWGLRSQLMCLALFFAIRSTADVYFEKADEDRGSAVPVTDVSFENDPSQKQCAAFTVMSMHLGVLI